MPQIITNTAELSCNQGTATSKLNVTSQDFVTIEGKAMAAEEDKQANSNIQPFKQCKLKPSSGGYLPCVPAPIQWEDTAEKDTIMGFYHNNDTKTPFYPESTAVIENFKNEYRNVTIDRNGTPHGRKVDTEPIIKDSKKKYVYKHKTTTNVMSYNQPRNYTTWRWQWSIINPNISEK